MEWKIGNGARQGAILSPLIFNFYINDVIDRISKNPYGCKLGIHMSNIQAYADDLTLMAPTAKNLQTLLNELWSLLKKLNLVVNCKKTVCMIFKTNGCKLKEIPNFTLDGNTINIVNSYKYLGIVLTDNLRIKLDIERVEKSFLKQFHCIYRKFYFTNEIMLGFLFKTHCLSFYGAELWHDKSYSLGRFNDFSINYHNAIKQILKLPTYESNHVACESMDWLTCKHFINHKIIAFALQVWKSQSTSVFYHRAYLLNNSRLLNDAKWLGLGYDIPNVFDNDIDAIKSRILFTQKHELRHEAYVNSR